MLLALDGYQIIEKLYESDNSLVYRGIQEAEQKTIIIKMLKPAYPSPEKIARFKREYKTTKNFNFKGVVNAYSLIQDQYRWLMVLEDFGGESLERLMPNWTCNLSEFLPLAIEITDILAQVHKRHIIHKDINPGNIVWNRITGQVKLIDFGISTVLSRENPTLRHPNILEGTLAYISPEQTGRMNRAIDYRTDFYSLGVTFYQLLTGQLPFVTTDVMELVHSHIAKQPISSDILQPNIPQCLSDIVMKLMAKNAEDRYQSAYGLKVDLEECRRQWQTKRRIELFPLCQQDFADQLQIPQKLYGREVEVQILLAASERISQGSSEMMLVTGYSGIGKSSLVQEIYKPITKQRGYFISGKFDQFQRDIPYTSLVQAFRSLIRQLLTESPAQILTWREKLLAALNPNAQVIIDVIPEVELIIGSQPAVPELSPMAAQNRFNLVLQNFIRVFTQPEHLLVIFLDDLQWADGASLKLISLLMTAVDSHYLLIICAYRNNEVSTAHPLRLMLDEIKQGGATVNEILLTPLDLNHIIELTANTCKCSANKVRELSQLLLDKTHGNPFFIKEFLQSLYTEELLKFDFEFGCWQWDINLIQTRNITDNVVDLMSDRLRKLPQKTQYVLQLAACIGNQFQIQTLAIVCEKSVKETADSLWSAIVEGLILPLGDTYNLIDLDVQGLADTITVEYKFAHDRIQQAAYSLILSAQRQIVHLQVGQLLLQNTLPQEREQKIFDIVNQLNLGRDRLEHQIDIDNLVQLNLMAGKKAKASAAYQPAFNYLFVGIELLNSPIQPANAGDSWQRKYDITLTTYLEAAEVAYLSGNFQEMEQWTEIVLRQAQTLLDKIKAYEIKIPAYIIQHKLSAAMETGLQALKFLGLEFPEQPSQADIFSSLEQTKIAWTGKQIEDLIHLKEMTDPDKLATVRILAILTNAASVASPELYPLTSLALVNLSLNYGNMSLSAHSYATYGIILCGLVGDIEAGYKFGQLALRLLQQFNTEEFESKTVYIFNCFIRHWKEHVRETLKPFLEVYQRGLEIGDLIGGALAPFMYVFHSYYVGQELTKLEQQMSKYSQAISELKQEMSWRWIELCRQPVLNLLGQSENPCRFVSDNYDEQSMLALYQQLNDRQAICFFYLHKLVLCYLFEEYPQAIANASIAQDYLDIAIGLQTLPIYYFYASLANLAVFPTANQLEQERILNKVAANQEKIKHWAQHAPMNFLHKFYLVEAERHRVLGDNDNAKKYFERAIALAHENEYINEKALAYELAAKFYLLRNQKHIARHYLYDAHYTYECWGAVAKVKHLEARYPEFLAQATKYSLTTTLTTSSNSTAKQISSALDITSVLKASQTISGEIVLEKLLEKLMKTVMENAGAQKGFLILDQEGNLLIEAVGSVEDDRITVLQSIPIDSLNPNSNIPFLSVAIINYVARSQENVVLNNAVSEGKFTRDPYIIATQPQSILCTPLLNQGKLNGILYLENNLTTGAFTAERVEVLKILSAQAAISIENSRLYEQLETYSRTLEQRVEARTQEIQEKNQELAAALENLKATQAQIIAQEKLASLGALTAGIAHEIKNPLNFVNNFAELTVELTEELIAEIENQKDQLNTDTREYIEEILNDLSQNSQKIQEHGKRADKIVNAMLMHSQGQTGKRQLANINTLLTESVHLVFQSMRAQNPRFNITIQTNYEDDLCQLNVVTPNISRVFINIINNACYAVQTKADEIGREFTPMLWLSTQDLGKHLEIRIRDNGTGISDEALQKIFNPFFTTKPTGQGTGLGLSISHEIIVQEHQGQIQVETKLGIYTEFIILLPKTLN